MHRETEYMAKTEASGNTRGGSVFSPKIMCLTNGDLI